MSGGLVSESLKNSLELRFVNWGYENMDGQDPEMELPTIYGWPLFEGYIRGYTLDIPPISMAEHMINHTSILGSWNSH